MNKIIYYFSGTGNSLRTARIIAQEIGGAKLISMSNDPSSVPANNASQKAQPKSQQARRERACLPKSNT